MRLIRIRSLYSTLAFILILLLTGCSWIGKPTSPIAVSIPSHVPPMLHNIEVDLLNNIKDNGFDANSTLTHGLGGLWVNWRYGTHPLQTNVNGTGNPDDLNGNSLRHDELTDLRYLHNLWSYTRQNPSDTRFAGEIARYTPIIKTEFAHSHNERGWLYDAFIDLYSLSHDQFYQDTALSLANSYAKAYDTRVGSIYQISPAHPYGSYRVDLVIEAGCALIQAGFLFAKQDWQQMGTRIVNFVYTHAYIKQYHTFANQMDDVLLLDGTVNPHEQFYLGRTKNYTVDGNQSQMGEISQIALSLLDAYNVTHEQDFLNKATELLNTYSLPSNSLSMWDDSYKGYFFSATFSGTTLTRPGRVFVRTKVKEAGRQILMLKSFHLANKVTNNRYRTMEGQLLQVALNDVYYPPGHGVLYEVKADWTPLTFHNDTLNDAVTTEAMGTELESLLSLDK